MTIKYGAKFKDKYSLVESHLLYSKSPIPLPWAMNQGAGIIFRRLIDFRFMIHESGL